MMTGFEAGYGSRPIDRDLVTGAAFISRAASSHASPPPVVVDTPIEQAGATTTRSPSVVPSVAQLKDSDGDDIMSPPPHEQNEDAILVSFEHILAEPDVEEVPMLDPPSGPPDDAPEIIQPEDIEPESAEPAREVNSIEYLIKRFDDGTFLEDMSRRKSV